MGDLHGCERKRARSRGGGFFHFIHRDLREFECDHQPVVLIQAKILHRQEQRDPGGYILFVDHIVQYLDAVYPNNRFLCAVNDGMDVKMDVDGAGLRHFSKSNLQFRLRPDQKGPVSRVLPEAFHGVNVARRIHVEGQPFPEGIRRFRPPLILKGRNQKERFFILHHKDGTVSAVGRSSEGQCDTADWSDIVQIAAADYASFGLRSDGTLVWTGYNHYDRCAVWSDLTGVYVGSYNVAALRSDGGHWIYPTPVGDETLPTGLVELALDTGFCFGLTADGNLVGTRETPEGWSDILCLSASATRLLALRSDGIVLSYAFRTQDELDFSALQGVVAIAAGATHSAVVLRDGSVQVLGDCSLGQGDTALWKLAVQPG